MKVKVARTGRVVTLAAPQRMFANERETVQVGRQGDSALRQEGCACVVVGGEGCHPWLPVSWATHPPPPSPPQQHTHSPALQPPTRCQQALNPAHPDCATKPPYPDTPPHPLTHPCPGVPPPPTREEGFAGDVIDPAPCNVNPPQP